MSAAASIQKVNLHELYAFLPADKGDLEAFTDICCMEFIKLEPHYRVLGVTPEESRYLFNRLMATTLHYPHSIKVLEKSTGRLVAIRTISVSHRDHFLDFEPDPFDSSQMSEKMMKMEVAIWDCIDNFWKLVDPKVEKILEWEISLVVAEHQRKGIAKALLEMNLDFEQLRKDGIQGILSEATSTANQKLLESRGYKCLYEYKRREWAKDMEDDTTGIKVMFKDIRE